MYIFKSFSFPLVLSLFISHECGSCRVPSNHTEHLGSTPTGRRTETQTKAAGKSGASAQRNKKKVFSATCSAKCSRIESRANSCNRIKIQPACGRGAAERVAFAMCVYVRESHLCSFVCLSGRRLVLSLFTIILGPRARPLRHCHKWRLLY